MTKKSSYGRSSASEPQRGQPKFTEGENQAKRYGHSGCVSGPEAAKKKTWTRYLKTLVPKFQSNKPNKHRKGAADCFKGGNAKQLYASSWVLQECSSLVRAVRRTAAGCFAAVAAAASGGEEGLRPCYMQLDQVSHGVKREAFGPVYLVT
ncbi:hypothetical protein ACP4OV_010774 [Aristida adscensionis]